MGLSLAVLAAVETGGYVSWWKPIPVFIVMLVWARLLTWIDKDTIDAQLPRIPINVGLLLWGILAFAIFFLVPGYAIALPVLVVMLGLELAVYLGIRNQKVGLKDLGKQFNEFIEGLKPGKKVKAAPAGQIGVVGAKGALMPVPDAEDPERVSYDAVQTLLTEPLKKGSERVDVAPTEGAVSVKYYVDGVSYPGTSVDRNAAAGAISYLKLAAGLDVEDRRKPQSGMLKLMLDGKRQELQIQTAGSTAGEFMRLMNDPRKRLTVALDDLGFTPEQLEIVKGAVKDNAGVVLIAAPKGQGLTTAMYGIVRAHDAFLTHIHTIERAPEVELEGITQNKLPAQATGTEEAKMADWVVSQEPDTIVCTEVTDPKTAHYLAQFGAGGKRAYVGLRANNTFDALSQWRKLVGDDALAMKGLSLIIVGRVMRKLCMACKAGYKPDPETLRKLNMNAEKVTELYQARTQPLRDPKGRPIPCDFCQDLRYKGRTGVYEVLVVDEDVKQVVTGGGSTNQLKQVFRKQRGKYLQEAALQQVEKGETSVQEVLRVLKGDGEAGAGGGGTSPRSGPRSAPRAPVGGPVG